MLHRARREERHAAPHASAARTELGHRAASRSHLSKCLSMKCHSDPIYQFQPRALNESNPEYDHISGKRTTRLILLIRFLQMYALHFAHSDSLFLSLVAKVYQPPPPWFPSADLVSHAVHMLRGRPRLGSEARESVLSTARQNLHLQHELCREREIAPF